MAGPSRALLFAAACMACSAEGPLAPQPRSSGSSVAGPPSAAAPAPTTPAEPRPPRLPASRSVRFEDGLDPWLPRAAPEEVGLDGAAVDALVGHAGVTSSDALLVLQGGRVVVERYFGRPRGPIETRSLTKSLVALAILALIADGRVRSLDEPLSTWLPAFAEGGRGGITLRHVLTHATGLDGSRSTDELNAAADRLAYAQSVPRAAAPGARFQYSNEAAQLLSGVISVAAGQPADAYLRRRLFEPLGVQGDQWTHDRAGNVQTYYGLALGARDLARVGLLLERGGAHGGRRLLPLALLGELATPSAVWPSFGLLWWLRVPVELAPRGSGEPRALDALRGRRFPSEEAFVRASSPLLSGVESAELRARLGRRQGPLVPAAAPIGFYGVGALGQYLAVYPAAGLVVVRQHRNTRVPASDARVTWKSFLDEVEALVPPGATRP